MQSLKSLFVSHLLYLFIFLFKTTFYLSKHPHQKIFGKTYQLIPVDMYCNQIRGRGVFLCFLLGYVNIIIPMIIIVPVIRLSTSSFLQIYFLVYRVTACFVLFGATPPDHLINVSSIRVSNPLLSQPPLFSNIYNQRIPDFPQIIYTIPFCVKAANRI